MEFNDAAPLADAEMHGFHTVGDLDIRKLLIDASTRWFRPNEVHAILSNHSLFRIQPKPVNLPTSGSVLLFDRKMLRNFRKDGHNWKKKKDGKTVQEAHEKLKIGNEERIHVYYARSEDDPNFYRRCYWLLDKNLERIVLVHYRQTSEETVVEHALTVANKMCHGSPLTPVNSNSGSSSSEIAGSATLSEEINSGEDYPVYAGSGIVLYEECNNFQKHELSLHDLNTLDWADLVEAPSSIGSAIQNKDDGLSSEQQMHYDSRNSMNSVSFFPSRGNNFGHAVDVHAGTGLNNNQRTCTFLQTIEEQEVSSPHIKTTNTTAQGLHPSCGDETAVMFSEDTFLNQNSFGHWSCINADSIGLVDGLQFEVPRLNDHESSDAPSLMDHSSTQQHIFNITDVSPSWAYCTEETKVLVVGFFSESHKHLEDSNMYCVIGDSCVTAEVIRAGVYRCATMHHTPGLVNLYLTLDGHTPISQIFNFEYRYVPKDTLDNGATSSEDKDKSKDEMFLVQLRLSHLLFSTTDSLSVLSSKVPSRFLKEAKQFASITAPVIEKDWTNLLKSGNNNKISSSQTTEDLFQLILKNKLQEWLLEKVAEGRKITAHDSQGQGVIHLCAILDYTWAVRLFSFSGLSLDFRDAFGWTALHWASYCGRENMVAALLSAGANPSLVTDPTPESPGGCTAADLASIQGYEGLAAYLAEKGLTEHFQRMKLSGNISESKPVNSNTQISSENEYSPDISEQELLLKESLAAYRNAADAADRIQAAFRDRSLKLQTKAVQLAKPEFEAANIIAALKIQHAFRNYSTRKLMIAAARIQSHFRTWQTRRNFLYMRRQAIRIQAAFRGHQVRKHYRKITWSVGVLEKAILRWRLKRKGLRGIQVIEEIEVDVSTEQESSAEEDFYRISREQAEDRVKRSVVRVQAMFRSYRAQQEYRQMKLAHEKAKLEYN